MKLTNAPNTGPPADGTPLKPPLTTQPSFMSGKLTSDDTMSTVYDTLLRIDVHCSSKETTDYPIKPFIHDFLQVLQKVNTKNNILPIDTKSSLGSITMEGDILTGEKLSKYIDGISTPLNRLATNDNNNTIHFHIHISTTLPLWQLKRNTTFYDWLTKGKIFLCTHGFTMSYNVLSAGFISNLSPTMHHHDTMKTIINNAVNDKGLNLEICLVPRNILYGQKNEKPYNKCHGSPCCLCIHQYHP